MVENTLLFTDVTLTDAQAALWQSNLPGGAAVKLAGHLDRAGLAAIEVLSPQSISVCLRAGQDPWRRITDMRAFAPGTPLRAVVNPLTAHGAGGIDVLTPEDLTGWVKRLASLGINEILYVDPRGDAEGLKTVAMACRNTGLKSIAALSFDQRLGDDDLCKAMLSLDKFDAIQLRDEAGLLTTDRLASLLAVLIAALNGRDLSLHTRCTTGLGPQIAFQAMQAGLRAFDTALPVAANGPSLPSSVNLLRGAASVGVAATGPSQTTLSQADQWLANVLDREGLPRSTPWNFDLAPYIHQLPAESLAMVPANQQDHAFAHECARIRAEIGDPPMMFPLGAAIAQQALWHRGGDRWARIHPVLRRTLQGRYGQFSRTVRQDLLGRIGQVSPDTTPPTPRTGALENRIGGDAGPLRDLPDYPETTPTEALTRGLVHHLQQKGGFRHLAVSGPDLTLSLSIPEERHV